MSQLIPAILAHTEEEFTSKIAVMKMLNTLFQIDVVDGEFAQPKTWVTPESCLSLHGRGYPAGQCEGPLSFEVDLMATHPLSVVDAWMHAGAARFIFHVEAKDDPVLVIKAAKKYNNREVGMSLNPETPWESLEPYLAALDCVMFLGVHPGASGQAFIPEVLEKIKSFHAAYPAMPIEVDGGVTQENIPQLVAAGANRFAMTSAIFAHEDPVKAFKELCPVLSAKGGSTG